MCAEFDSHPADLDVVMRAFGLPELSANVSDPAQLSGMFSEWLLYDVSSPIFENMTGLAYFVKSNPLQLDEVLLQSYRDLLTFTVGLFEISAVFPGERVVLKDMRGVAYEVFDVSTSLSTQVHTTLWSRIARVGGVYQMVGSSGFVLPVVMGSHAKKYAGVEEIIDAKAAAMIMYKSQNIQTTEEMRRTATTIIPTPADVKRAADKFDTALAAAGMSDMLSSATLKKWVNNEKQFPIGFPIKSLFFLLPDNCTDRHRDTILDTAQDYLAVCPRKVFGGKSSNEQAIITANQTPQYEFDQYSYDDYRPAYEAAYAYMQVGDSDSAYEAYEHCITRLLDDRTPIFLAFRLYANAALSCFMNPEHGYDGLGIALVNASLRLNPQYDFGKRQYDQYVAPYYKEPIAIDPADIELAKVLRTRLIKDGEREYRRSSFRHYEDFLTKAGVSLSYTTKTTPSVFSTNPNNPGPIKIGRNDPCYCGSGKKYKKCCGA